MENKKRFSNKLNTYFRDNIKLSFVSKENVIVVTKQDKVYEFRKGLFTNSVVITNKNEEVVKPLIEKSVVEELCGKGVIDFKIGFYHAIARTNDGKVYCWGQNYFGALGNGEKDERICKPVLNEYLSGKNIIDISCGAKHSLVLTNDGDVYAWGMNNDGQIGNGNTDDVVIPYHVKGFNGERVKAIACGGWHSMALTETGNVYSWGKGEYGQLGIGIEDQNCNSPKQIEMNEVVVEKISCGRRHSLLLSRDGDIYVFGRNESRQLGTDVDYEVQLTPKKLIHTSRFIDIASHSHYNISNALSENDLYYIWGKCGEEEIKEPKETRLKSFDDIFTHYLQINYEPIKERIVPFDDTFMQNGEYKRKFNELKLLGEGCYGKVFKVIDKWDEFYAIKKIRPTGKANEFLKELEICPTIADLNDERLVKYYNVWLEQDSIKEELKLKNFILYIQMQLCEKSLNDVIEEIEKDPNLKGKDSLTPLGYFVTSEIFIEILKSVLHLHTREKPFIHRDLKPDNIMLKIDFHRRSYVKIGDFGLAAIHEFPQQSHTEGRGHITYAAPEVMNGRKYDIKADIYSLGVLVQKLFDIDLDRDYMSDISPPLNSKYQVLSDLYKAMTDIRSNKRPNCEEILNDKHLWALNINEFDDCRDIEIFEKSSIDKDSYVLKVIKHLQTAQTQIDFLSEV